MNKPKFTPGPWEVVHTDDDSCMSMTVIAPKGLFDPNNSGRLSNEDHEKLEKVIAITFHQLMPIAGFEACEKDEDDGNAFLMAAAPDMYEALRELLELLEEHEPNWYLKKHFTKASQALAKAQGGEP